MSDKGNIVGAFRRTIIEWAMTAGAYSASTKFRNSCRLSDDKVLQKNMLRSGAQEACDEQVDVLLQACGFAKQDLQSKERPRSCAKKLPVLCGNPRERVGFGAVPNHSVL